MAGRPPTYSHDDERPVSVSQRVPKALYDQAQHYAGQRRMTLTELVLDGLKMRLETPADPRELLLSDKSNTVMQQLQEMVTAAVQAELAKLLSMALPLPTHDRPPTSHDMLHDNGNTILQTESLQQGFDATRYRLGTLCPQGHNYQGTGHSLRRQHKGDCVECGKLAKRAKRARHVPLG
jgi:hypothetical protein